MKILCLHIPDYSLLLFSKSSPDLGLSAINTQTVINSVIGWAVVHDVFYVCNILVGMDLSDVSAVGSADTFVNLLKGYKMVTLDQVVQYQTLLIPMALMLMLKAALGVPLSTKP